MNPRRLSRCLSLSHPGWAGQAGGEGDTLFLELLSLGESLRFRKGEPYAAFSSSLESFS